jgi:hypothetical protein
MKFDVKSWITNPNIRKTVSFKIDFENYDEIIFVAVNRLKYLLMKFYGKKYDFSLVIIDFKTSIEKKKVLIKAQCCNFIEKKEDINQLNPKDSIEEIEQDSEDKNEISITDEIEYDIL